MSISTATGTSLSFSNKLVDQKTGLSKDLIDRINLKASLISEARKVNEEAIATQHHIREIESLARIAEQIRSSFTFRNSSTMFMNDVIQALADKHRGSFISTGKLL